MKEGEFLTKREYYSAMALVGILSAGGEGEFAAREAVKTGELLQALLTKGDVAN